MEQLLDMNWTLTFARQNPGSISTLQKDASLGVSPLSR